MTMQANTDCHKFELLDYSTVSDFATVQEENEVFSVVAKSTISSLERKVHKLDRHTVKKLTISILNRSRQQ